MARRSRAREVALQLLYEADRNPNALHDRDREFVEQRLRGAALRQFALELTAGVRARRDQLDKVIQDAAHNWTLSRMTPIDRSILRMACFEIIHRSDIPPKVAIDEAIELAKRYGTGESARFVNGILDRIAANHPPEPGEVVPDRAAGGDSPGPVDTLSSSPS